MFLRILLPSTQVTKSSIFSPNPHMSLFYDIRGSLDRFCHSQPCQHDGEASACKGRDGDAVFDGGELASCGEDGHVVEFGEEEVFVLVADGVLGGEGGEFMG